MTRLKKRYVINFPGHLADCEFNYRRLRRLMPGWRIPSSEYIDPKTTVDWHYLAGQSQHEIGISIEVCESAKYTTIVHIAVYSRLQKQMSWGKNYTFRNKKINVNGMDRDSSMADSSTRAKLTPNYAKTYSLDVRLYHDATVAEVIAWQGHRRIQPRHEYPNPKMYHRDEKAQLNRFLGELLEHCLANGRVRQPIIPVS